MKRCAARKFSNDACRRGGCRRLSDLEAGTRCTVTGFCGCERAACELQRMGVVAGEVLRVVRGGTCLLVECGGCRLALRPEMGSYIEVIEWGDAA